MSVEVHRSVCGGEDGAHVVAMVVQREECGFAAETAH